MTLGRSTNANQVYGYSLIGNHEARCEHRVGRAWIQKPP